MAPSHLMSKAGRATVHGWDWGARMGIKPLGGSFERPPKPNPDIGTCLTFFHIGRLRAKTRQDSPFLRTVWKNGRDRPKRGGEMLTSLFWVVGGRSVVVLIQGGLA